MNKMKVVAIRVNKEPTFIRVIYEKKGTLYMRTGEDGFERGKPLKAPLKAVLNKWGFRVVENPPEFRDAEELIDNLTGFSLNNDGKVTFSTTF